MSDERFLVTGAHGCIGTWVVRQLVAEGCDVVSLDIADNPKRWPLVMSERESAGVGQVRADITDLAQVERALDDHGTTHIIHLAALQVPFCRADPPLGARVNVLGTVNIFEAVKRRAERIGSIVYASSIAAYDSLEEGGGSVEMSGHPGTLYGVYKRANEGTAHIYWADHAVASVGLRPHTVFGPARDQGLTSAPTTAMLAAAAGIPYTIPFGGVSQFQYAPDAAQAFIAAARANATGATVHNLAGSSVGMPEVVSAIEAAAPDAAGLITFADVLLPFPGHVDAQSFEALAGPLAETPFPDAVADAVTRFGSLLARGLVEPPKSLG